jgi:hypothetical protein
VTAHTLHLSYGSPVVLAAHSLHLSGGPSVVLAAHPLHLSGGLLIAIALLGLANLGLMVTALVSLFSRPEAAVRFHRRWLWAIPIVLVSWVGPLAYLAVGRIDAPLPDDTGAGEVPAAERARRAVELLYGPEAPR